MNKDNLKLLNLEEGASKDEIYENYIRLHAKYKKEKNEKKLAELDRVYGELLTTGSSKVNKPNQFKINTKQFVILFILALLTISGALYYKLIKGSPPKPPIATQTESNDSRLSDESLKPLVPLGENQSTPTPFIEADSTKAMVISDAADPRLQISNKEKIDVVVTYISSLKKDSNAQGKVMSCYFKYQEKKEPGVPCAYMDAAAEYALNTPGKSSSVYFAPEAVTERAYLHLYSLNNVSEAVAREHLKQIRFDVSQIVTDIALKQAQRVGANQERSRPEQDTYIDPSESDSSEDDAVRAAQMAASPALTQ